ncbi:hypothetical protein GGG16DRAFT_123977 [Schizophyllum commune]
MSSLSSFLVPKGSKSVDSELDALFKNAVPVKPEAPQPSKTDASTSKADSSATAKADKVSAHIASADKKAKKRKAAEPEPEQPTPKRSKKDKAEKKSKKQAATVAADEAADDDEPTLSAPTTTSAPADAAEEAENDAMDESPDSYTPPTHISATTSSNPKHPKKRTKFAPEEETPEMRDARTLFVGNVPIEVMGKKPLIKSLQRHLLSAVPHARAESIRFRSVPVPRDAIAKAAAKGRQDVRSSTNHANTRTSAWRANQNDDDEAPAPAKTYLTPAEKKRIAAITGDLGEKANSVTAYLVLAHPAPRPANLPPLPTADPYQAAIQIAAKMDGVEWEGRVLRVDLARRDPAVLAAVATTATTTETPVDLTALLPDPKRTLFVGNLDYGAKEDDVRAFFEAEDEEDGENDEEGGSEAASDAEETQASAKPSTSTHHVARVRIVRDPSTGVGKGFAYVQFVDRTPVDELLALPAGSLKFAKRKLRVQKCKTVLGASTKVKADKHAPGGKQAPRKPVVVPSGDPTLGSRLAGLPKDARKAAKAADAARVARRAAKKAAKKDLAPDADVHFQAHPRLPTQTPTQRRPPGSRSVKLAWQWAARWKARSVSEYGRRERSGKAKYNKGGGGTGKSSGKDKKRARAAAGKK